jgi:hypothetical protein
MRALTHFYRFQTDSYKFLAQKIDKTQNIRLSEIFNIARIAKFYCILDYPKIIAISEIITKFEKIINFKSY